MTGQDALSKAKTLIANFIVSEYNTPRDAVVIDIRENPSDIGLAHTETDQGYPIQVSVDLVNYRKIVDVFGSEQEVIKYDSLDELIESELKYLNFDELVGSYL